MAEDPVDAVLRFQLSKHAGHRAGHHQQVRASPAQLILKFPERIVDKPPLAGGRVWLLPVFRFNHVKGYHWFVQQRCRMQRAVIVYP